MLFTEELHGEVKYQVDNVSCLLNGENGRRGMAVGGSGGQKLSLKAITFKDGELVMVEGFILVVMP